MTELERVWAKIRLNSELPLVGNTKHRFYDADMMNSVTEYARVTLNSMSNFWDRPENPNLRVVLPWDFERFLKFDMTKTPKGSVWGMILKDPYKAWADSNLRGLCGVGREDEERFAIYFEEERDAVLFKLFFADDLL